MFILHQRILDHLNDAVILFDDNLALVYLNVAAEMLFAVSSRQSLGLSARQFFPTELSVEKELRRTLVSGATLTKHNVVMQLQLQPATVNLTFTPMLDIEQQKAVIVQVQQVDRHLRISMEEQLLAQQNAARMLVRGLAHEIKNPLGGLRGAAQLLDAELREPELREYTKIIIEESDRLQSLMDRMLGPNKPPQKTLVNVHRILERVRQLVQVESPATVVIDRDYDPSIPKLYGDSDQLIQAILNIVRNAAQAVGERGHILIRTRIHRQVTIGRRRSRLAVKIEVIDDGPGIEPELIGQIFYPMVTGRPDGTGLGLSIAQSLINQHGGLVECSSVPRHTVFSVFLPLENGYG